MATSSLLEHIRVNDPKAVEEPVASMEASAKAPIPLRTDEDRSGIISDPERMRGFVSKALRNRSVKK